MESATCHLWLAMMHQGLEPGTTLRNRYEILALIDQGGMGAVYKAADRRLPGRLCAVKEILPTPGMGAESLTQTRRQFLEEASTLARLDHPGLPKVSDYFSLDPESVLSGRDYLVMDYVPGQNLEQLAQEARRQGRFLDEQEVLRWIEQLCAALEYLHSQSPPVLHRDVKPANIKLTPDGRIKLVDFGLVKCLDPEDPRTVTGLRGLGSLPYTPIEQYAGEIGHTDTRSDLYSLGATLYQLLTGQAPPSAQERFLNPQALRLPREINPALSPRLERAVLATLALHPKDRPGSVATWAAMLSGGADPGQERIAASSAPKRAKTVRPVDETWGQALRANWWLLVLVLALVVAAVLLTFR
jgi:serine/threonine protein kinase